MKNISKYNFVLMLCVMSCTPSNEVLVKEHDGVLGCPGGTSGSGGSSDAGMSGEAGEASGNGGSSGMSGEAGEASGNGGTAGSSGNGGFSGMSGQAGEASGNGGTAGSSGSSGDSGSSGSSGIGGAGDSGSSGTSGVAGSAGDSGSSGSSGMGGAGDSGAAGTSGSGGAGNGGSGGTAGSSCTTGVVTFNVTRSGLLDGNSTFWEQARDVAFGPDGSMYIVGGTTSPDFPTTVGAYDRTLASGGTTAGSNGPMDMFVTKLASDGSIAWSTYVGGPNYDLAYAVEIDDTGVYVAGRCGKNFPVTSGVLQTVHAGDSGAGLYGVQDGCIVKLTLDGSSLIYSTFFGDTASAFIRDIDIDSSHRVHAALGGAVTSMANKLTSNAMQSTVKGSSDAFYAVISADATHVEYGTYIGGTESGSYAGANPAVRVLSDGSAYFVTSEPSADAPTTSGAFNTVGNGGVDLILAKFTPQNAVSWCSYIGGSGGDGMDTHSLAVDSAGRPVVITSTSSTDFPGSTHIGLTDAGIVRLSADGSTLVSSTQFGGSGNDGPEGISIDNCGNVYVTGFTFSTDLPVTSGALVTTSNGSRQGFMLVLSPDLSTRRYASWDGITGQYANRSNMLSSNGLWGIVGSVWQMNPFPATSGYDGTIDGTHAAFFRTLQLQ